MKSFIRFLLLFLFTLHSSLLTLDAQVPQGFSYQAVARADDGSLLSSTNISVKIGLHVDSPTGSLIWEETHMVTTNEFGLFTLQVGDPDATQGSGSAPSFNSIDWTAGDYFLEVSVDGTYIGASQLLSVPYAMAAETVNDLDQLNIVEDPAHHPDSALFEVKRADGQTVFAVYNDGVRIYVDENAVAKRSKGGFAIGGFDASKGVTHEYFRVTPDSVRIYLDTSSVKGSKGGFAIGGIDAAKGTPQEFLRVTPDSVRVYIDPSESKGSKGGFAIGGFDAAKGIGQEYLRITDDSARVYVDNTPIKGSKGGFAIGGFDAAKGPAVKFMDMTPQNYFIGHESGADITTGLYNSFLGYQTGLVTSTGSTNALFGYQAGYSNISGSSNLFLGYQSGFSNTDGNFNSFMGYKTGYSNTTGNQNTFLGSFAGLNNSAGDNNTFAGYNAGLGNTTGSNNVFMGNQAGYSNSTGESNVFIGDQSGYLSADGQYNVFVGHFAGYNSTSSFSNVFVGYNCGYANTIGTSNVFIGESAGKLNTTGASNVFIGDQAGQDNVTGHYNVHIGRGAGQQANSSDNIFIGFGSGFDNSSGYNNLFIGNQAGFNNTTGQNNISLGVRAGYGNNTGSGNIFIGYQTGWSETGSNKLYIDNSSTTTPLIYGDFNSNYLNINGNLSMASTYFRISNNPGTGASPTSYAYQGAIGSGTKSGAFAIRDALWVDNSAYFDSQVTTLGYININVSGNPGLYVAGDEAIWYNGTYFSWGYGGAYNFFGDEVGIGTLNAGPTYLLAVNGNAAKVGGGLWSSWSDKRLKDIQGNYQKGLKEILELEPIIFKYKQENPLDLPSNQDYIGLVAQDVQIVFPEAVNVTHTGYLDLNAQAINMALINAIKEQQNIIDSQNLRIFELESKSEEMEILKIQIEELKNLVRSVLEKE